MKIFKRPILLSGAIARSLIGAGAIMLLFITLKKVVTSVARPKIIS